MGWKEAAPANIREKMSDGQRRKIISQRERLDGVAPATYAGEVLPDWTILQANQEIERLDRKLEEQRTKHKPRRGIRQRPFDCPLCGQTPCAEDCLSKEAAERRARGTALPPGIQRR